MIEAGDTGSSPWWQQAWTVAKRWHRVRLGPVSLLIRLARSGPSQRLPIRSFTHRASTWSGSPARQEHTGPSRELGPVLIVGVGRTFGTIAAHFFAEQGAPVSVVARDANRLEAVVRQIRQRGLRARAYACDVTHENEVRRLVASLLDVDEMPELCIYSVENHCPGDVLRTQVAAFEEVWRANCLGGFIVGREVGRRMASRGNGSIVFMGGTSSVLGRAGYLNLSVSKHGLRALAHVMARELGPKGVHVAHCIIDGDVSGNEAETHSMNPEHVAREILKLHQQPPDCWTAEMDLRPAKEAFWEHC